MKHTKVFLIIQFEKENERGIDNQNSFTPKSPLKGDIVTSSRCENSKRHCPH